MQNDLTTSKIDRQNILNNDFALAEIQDKGDFKAIIWDGKFTFTKEMVATCFDVEPRTIDRYISDYSEELRQNGYEVLKGKRLREFLAVLFGMLWILVIKAWFNRVVHVFLSHVFNL